MHARLTLAVALVAGVMVTTIPPGSPASAEVGGVGIVQGVPDRSGMAASKVAQVDGSELELQFGRADLTKRPKEVRAVDEYLELRGESATRMERADLKVATIPTPGDGEMVLVAPLVSTVEQIEITRDSDAGEVSAGVEWSIPEETPVAGGPGMGTWPSWRDRPHWTLELRLYELGDYIGKATFQSMRRKLRENDPRWDRHQVARYALAQPERFDPADRPVRVNKLWMSHRLKPAARGKAQAWTFWNTRPKADWKDCESHNAINIAIFTFGVKNCNDYDVWMGEPGHYRISYDQGRDTRVGSRELAFVAGFQMDDGAKAPLNWYEFVTLQVGRYSWAPGTTRWKCSSTARGSATSTTKLYCRWP